MPSYTTAFDRLYPDKAQVCAQIEATRTAATAIEDAVALIEAETPAQAVLDQCTAITAQIAVIRNHSPAAAA